MRILAILVILSTVLIAGCVQIQDFKSKLPQQREPGIIPSTQSVMITVLNPTEGENISSKNDFLPFIQIANIGNSESEGVVCISGLSETFRGFPGCECQSFTLSKTDETGETTQQIEFGPYRPDADEPSKEIMTTTTRYAYETTGTAKACIKKDQYSSTGCQVGSATGQKKNILTRTTNGAVIIKKITEEITPQDKETATLTFNIEIEKASKGEMYDPDKAGYTSCRTEENQYKAVTGELNGLPRSAMCTDAEIGEDGTGIMTCEARDVMLLDSRGNELFPNGYEPEIEIKLRYGYEQISSTKFSVNP